MSLPQITNKQQEILKYLYHFRFLNRIQIQALLKHKDYKTINLWLKVLTEKEFTARIYSNKFGENTKPAIYFIGPNGIKYLRVNTNCPREQINKLWREKERSQTFITNCQLLADIYLDLKSRSGDKKKYSVQTKSEFINPDSPLHFLAGTDTDLLIEKTEEGMKKYYLLAILDDSLPGYSIRKRIKNYFDLYFSNGWEENTGENFPETIFACETLPMVFSVRKLISRLKEEYGEIEDMEIKTATMKEASGQIS